MNVRFAAFLAALAVATASTASTANTLPTVHPGVHRALRKAGTVDLVVELAQTTESTLEEIKESAFPSREAKITVIKDKLQAQNTVAASEVTKLIGQEARGLHEGFKNFWIANQITVSAASFELVEKLAAMPSIGNIREQEFIKIEKRDNKELIGQEEWGVKIIGANKVWADGNIGQGVIVANIDTGVHGTHEVLKRNFLGKNGWYDPETLAADPHDIHGHGSHTMGTIAGSKGVGVAPGAQWIACKGCRWYEGDEGPEVGCSEEDLTACAQFVLCPHDANGENADCSLAPRVVSNSWGDAGGRPWFKPAVDAWVKAGIVPVFSQGNSDPACSTAGSPGGYPNVIGVGATDSADTLAWFSSKGPTVDTKRRKPDISAPGVLVRSADYLADDAYWAISGTSMAAPHVTGAVALLLSAQPDFTIDEVKVALYTTTDQKGLGASNYTCGATSDQAWPNNQYGHGRLNVLNAYEGFRPSP